MSPPSAGRTARARVRAELLQEIKAEARRQLATSGADGLSLRAVARSLGMVSSALYRYFPSRDDLLTALIIDAYDAIGTAAETAAGAAACNGPRGRWAAICRAVRSWALAHPHEYALIYGSPVPGYQAPLATVESAGRVPLAFAAVLRDATVNGGLAAPEAAPAAPETGPLPESLTDALPDALAAQAMALGTAFTGAGDATVPASVLVKGVIAWTQLFGMVSFELFGQFTRSFDPADELFEHAIATMMNFVGL